MLKVVISATQNFADVTNSCAHFAVALTISKENGHAIMY